MPIRISLGRVARGTILALTFALPGSQLFAEVDPSHLLQTTESSPLPQGAAGLASQLAGKFAGVDSNNKVYLQDERQLLTPLGKGVWLHFRRERDGVLYRERVIQLLDQPNGYVLQQTWRLVAPEIPVTQITLDKLQSDAISGNDIENCRHIWRPVAESRSVHYWRAEINPDNCVIYSARRDTEIRIGSESKLTATTLEEAERGFTIDGTFLWGTPVGQFARMTRVE